jgi:hypothetical protein
MTEEQGKLLINLVRELAKQSPGSNVGGSQRRGPSDAVVGL